MRGDARRRLQAGSRVAGRSDVQASANSCLQVLKVDEIIRTASHSSGKNLA
jgi:hypothetical protein